MRSDDIALITSLLATRSVFSSNPSGVSRHEGLVAIVESSRRLVDRQMGIDRYMLTAPSLSTRDQPVAMERPGRSTIMTGYKGREHGRWGGKTCGAAEHE